jgi:hypothetical protein
MCIVTLKMTTLGKFSKRHNDTGHCGQNPFFSAQLKFSLLWIPLRETPSGGRLDDILASMQPGKET